MTETSVFSKHVFSSLTGPDVKMPSELENKIIKQIEYYFGDINLPRDKFLKEKITEDEGWITLDILLTFKRLANLSTDQAVIADAVEKSEEKLVVVSEDRKKLRRNPEKPLPELNDDRKKELSNRTGLFYLVTNGYGVIYIVFKYKYDT